MWVLRSVNRVESDFIEVYQSARAGVTPQIASWAHYSEVVQNQLCSWSKTAKTQWCASCVNSILPEHPKSFLKSLLDLQRRTRLILIQTFGEWEMMRFVRAADDSPEQQLSLLNTGGLSCGGKRVCRCIEHVREFSIGIEVATSWEMRKGTMTPQLSVQ